jgi:hypothetical protein
MNNSHKYNGQFNTEIPIFKKLYDLFRNFYTFEFDFPKKDRYTLGQRCETYILEILEGIMAAAQISNKEEKRKILERTSQKLDSLKVLIRLAFDVNALTEKRYILCENHLQEVGRMLGGWIKSTSE